MDLESHRVPGQAVACAAARALVSVAPRAALRLLRARLRKPWVDERPRKESRRVARREAARLCLVPQILGDSHVSRIDSLRTALSTYSAHPGNTQ